MLGAGTLLGPARAWSQSAEQPTGIALDEFADSLIAEYMYGFSVPALSIAFVRGADLLAAKAYGVGDRGSGAPATTASRFRIASNSKQITSAAIFTLIDAGKLRLEDRVFAADGVLPEFGRLGHQQEWLHAITVRHLLTHTGGGWDIADHDPAFGYPGVKQLPLIERILSERPLSHAPGERFSYSNFGYLLLGRVIERASGFGYQRYVRNVLLDRCDASGLKIATPQPQPDEVRYYSQGDGDAYVLPLWRLDSAGGWVGTPTDLARVGAAIFSARDGAGGTPLLMPASLSAMTEGTPANPHYACGWLINCSGNCWHFGSLPGSTSLLVHTAAGLTWSAFLNTRSANPGAQVALDRLMWRIVRRD